MGLGWLAILSLMVIAGCRTLPSSGQVVKNRPALPASAPRVQPVQYAQPVSPGAYPQLPALPPAAYTGQAVQPWQHCPPGTGSAQLIPPVEQQWSPPGLKGPWPDDEYIYDGGDQQAKVQVSPDWTVHGLDTEDTVAHFDTLDGRTEVSESNRVPIYAPRFAAVRKIYGASYHQQLVSSRHVEKEMSALRQDDLQVAGTFLQPVQAEHQFSASSPGTFRERTRGLNLNNTQRIRGFVNEFLPYEDFKFIRRGEFDNSEKSRLAARMQAATVWSHDQGVQVVIDETLVAEASGAFLLGEARHYELPPGKPRLRIVKVASSEHARPGDVIDFTLRFDNVGDQVIGNVTIIDNLTSRLEYVPDSAQSSLTANFASKENDEESLMLRWEITDPLEVGQGGVIRFQCRVR